MSSLRAAQSGSELWSGIFIGAVGTIFTVAGYLAAREHGGSFLIFHGMIVVGVGMAWRGYARLGRIADVEAADKASAKRSP